MFNFIRRNQFRKPDSSLLSDLKQYIEIKKDAAARAERDLRAAVEAKRQRELERAAQRILQETTDEEKKVEDTGIRFSRKYTEPSVPQTPKKSHFDSMDVFRNSAFGARLFADYFVGLIREKKMLNSTVYKRADISKQVFSNIISGKSMPSKNTVLSLAVGMKLNIKETEELLMKAGYAFSDVITSDLIVKYFIEHENYDIFEINDVLYLYNMPLLGSR